MRKKLPAILLGIVPGIPLVICHFLIVTHIDSYLLGVLDGAIAVLLFFAMMFAHGIYHKER